MTVNKVRALSGYDYFLPEALAMTQDDAPSSASGDALPSSELRVRTDFRETFFWTSGNITG